VDLAPALDAVARLIEPTARGHSVTVVLEPTTGSLRVRVNEADLQHVLLNLLLNAVQACEHGGRVTLGASGGDPVRIHVTDNGSGIPPEMQKRIFEPFFSARRGGTGLGLFLALDFVRQWGGDIQVRSTPGAGSTFEVTLPAAGAAVHLRVLA
jgi:signal transduction histidine kinase